MSPTGSVSLPYLYLRSLVALRHHQWWFPTWLHHRRPQDAAIPSIRRGQAARMSASQRLVLQDRSAVGFETNFDCRDVQQRSYSQSEARRSLRG
jgi:hypothetical protein